MTLEGWVFLIISWGIILGLTIFCFVKVFSKKGAEMKKNLFLLILVPFILVNISGCLPLIVGGAAGALGAYATSRDTIQGDTDKPYDSLWSAALEVGRIRGTVKQEDNLRGYIELMVGSSKVYVYLIRMTESTTRLRVSSRKHHLPNIDLAQDIFVKIIEQARQ